MKIKKFNENIDYQSLAQKIGDKISELVQDQEFMKNLNSNQKIKTAGIVDDENGNFYFKFKITVDRQK